MKGMPITKNFVQRDAEMAQLEKFFKADVGAKRKWQKVFVVHGLGGMGKTQICVEYVRRHEEDFTAVFWLDGSSKDALRQSCVGAAVRVAQECPSSAILFPHDTHDVDKWIAGLLRWLSLKVNTEWLLVMDNVDREWQGASGHADPQSYNLEDYFPPADHGNILITTRLSRLQQMGASLRLGAVNNDVARKMLESRAGRKLPGVCVGRS
jgi:hypothetical protein